MSITAEKKQALIGEYQTKKEDTGSPQVQIAVLTARITELSGHMQTHKKDLHSRRGLLAMVAKRRKLLDYLKRKDESLYQDIITRLNIRK